MENIIALTASEKKGGEPEKTEVLYKEGSNRKQSSWKEELSDFLGLAHHSFIVDTFGNFLFSPGKFCPDVAASGIKHGLTFLPCGSSYFY